MNTRPFFTLALVAGIIANHSATAADITWDISPGTVGAGDSSITGGTGDWDLTNGNWTADAGVNNVAWNNALPDNAIFGGTAGTVSLTTGISVGNITFNSSLYEITGNTLTFSSATPVVTVGGGFTATISSVMAGGNGFTKSGAGQLTLSGSSSNTYTGTTILDNGNLVLGKTGGATAIAGTLQLGGGNTNQPNLRMSQSNQFAAGTVMTSANASGNWVRFDLLDTNQTLAGLSAGTAGTQSGAVIQNGGNGINTTTLTSVLTLDGSGTYVFNGHLRNVDSGGTGKLAISKTGSGTQTLAGTVISYTGPTTVSNGTLELLNATNFASATTVSSGGTLRISNSNASAAYSPLGGTAAIVVDSGAVLELNNATTGYGNRKTLSGSVSGAGTINVVGTGYLALNSVNNITLSGQINIQSGGLGNDGGASANAFGATTADLDISAGAFFDLRGGAPQFDALTGAGDVINSFTSNTITLGVAGGTGVFTGTLKNSGNAITGSGSTQVLSLTKTGSGTQTLTNAASSYTGTTTVNDGLLILQSTRLIAGAKVANGAGILEINSTVPFVTRWNNGGTISGNGTINKTGTGVFGTTGAVNFSGTINILDGRLHNDNVTGNWTGSTADVNISTNGILDLRANDIYVDQLTGDGTIWNSHPAGGGDVLYVGVANGTSSFAGVINGNGSQAADNPNGAVLSLTKRGTGIFTVTGGANVYSGATTVDNGILRISGGDNRLPVGTNLVVNGGATFGGTFDLNALNQTVAQLSAGSGVVSGTVTNLAAGTGTLSVSGTSTFDGVIQDGGVGMITALTKSGTGTLTLTGVNTHSGTTLITGGALRQANAMALSPNSNVNMNGGIVDLGVTDFTAVLGTGNGQVQFTGSGGFGAFGANRDANIGGAGATMTWNTGNFVPTGSSLILSGANSDSTIRFINPIDLNGGSGRIASFGGTAAIDAELVGGVTNGTLTLATANGTINVTSQIAGDVIFESGNSGSTNFQQVLLNRAGGNAITGSVQIGTNSISDPGVFTNVRYEQGDQIADTSVVTFGAANGRWAYYNLNGFNETIAGLSNLAGRDGGVVQLVETDASPATNSTLTLNVASGTQSYYGHIRDRGPGFSNHPTGGKLNFVKTGLGTQELTTWNGQSWSGTTDVDQGTLRLILNNGVELRGAVGVDAGAILELAPTGANDFRFTGAVSGAGDVVKSGTGTASFWGSVSFTGEIVVQTGRLRNDGNFANWAANTANLSVEAAGIFDMRADSVTVNSLYGSGLITNTFGNGAGVYDTLTVGVVNGSGDFSGSIQDFGSGVGDNQGGIALTKVGTGKQTLGGASTYTGPTVIVEGELNVNGNIATSSLLTIQDGGILSGSGTVGAVNALDGSQINPGNSPGLLTTIGNVTTSSGTVFHMEISGTTAGSDYDQLSTTGAISLDGTLVLTLGYAPAVNDKIFLWLNDGTDAIGGAGQFTGLPEGAIILAGPDYWQISYVDNGDAGSMGNDISLTYIPEPSFWGLTAVTVLTGLSIRRR